MREADDPHHRRGPRGRGGRRAERPRLPHQHLVPLPGPLLRHGHRRGADQEGGAGRAARLAASRRRSARRTGFDWKFYWVGKTSLPVEPVPPELDYDLWLGPAPWKPYSTHRVHGTFRGYWDYDGGGLGDMGMHYLDPVQYILGKDDTSPVEVWADGPQQHPDACGTWRRIEMKYADGCMIVLDGENRDKEAAFLEGPEGKVFRGFKSDIKGFEEKLAALPDPEPQITDFSESVRTRRPFALNERNGHRSCTLVNLGKAAVQLGRTLRYDPVKEIFVGDEEANRLVNQPVRAPWRLPA